MKRCTKCNLVKPASQFAWQNKAKSLRVSACKDCRHKYDNERYCVETEIIRNKKAESQVVVRKRNTEKIFFYLMEHPCIQCGETDVRFLQFDHLEDNKKFGVSQRMRNCKWETIKQEIDKCQVLCVKCHMLKTHAGSYRFELFEQYQKPLLEKFE